MVLGLEPFRKVLTRQNDSQPGLWHECGQMGEVHHDAGIFFVGFLQFQSLSRDYVAEYAYFRATGSATAFFVCPRGS